MTVQAEEKITVNGKKYILLSRPFEPFLEALDIKLVPFGSYCWRGYMGEWEIENNVLYLKGINLRYRPEDEEKLIPLKLDEVVYQATWYTGKLRVPFGEQYRRTDYNYPLSEKEMIFEVENGLITDHKIIENDKPEYEDDGLPF